MTPSTIRTTATTAAIARRRLSGWLRRRDGSSLSDMSVVVITLMGVLPSTIGQSCPAEQRAFAGSAGSARPSHAPSSALRQAAASVPPTARRGLTQRRRRRVGGTGGPGRATRFRRLGRARLTNRTREYAHERDHDHGHVRQRRTITPP